MSKGNISKILKIIFGISIIIFLFLKIDFKSFSSIDFISNYEYLLLSAFFFLFSLIILQSLRLFILINEFSKKFIESIKLVIISTFFNSFLLGNIGGDGFKIFYIKKKYGLGWDKSLSYTLIDRLSGLFILFVMGVVYVILFYRRLKDIMIDINFSINEKLYYILALVFVLIIFFVLLYIFKPKYLKNIYEKIKRNLYSTLRILREFNRKKYIYALFYSIIIHSFRIFGFYFLILFLNEDIFWPDLLLIIPLTAFVSMIPISIGALGVREGIIAFLLIIFGIAEDEAIMVSLLNRAILIFISIIGALVYIKSDFKIKNN